MSLNSDSPDSSYHMAFTNPSIPTEEPPPPGPIPPTTNLIDGSPAGMDNRPDSALANKDPIVTQLLTPPTNKAPPPCHPCHPDSENSYTPTTTTANHSPAPFHLPPCRLDFSLLPNFPPPVSPTNDGSQPSGAISSIPPSNWSNSFLFPFHLQLKQDPAKFHSLLSSFLSITTGDKVQAWLSIKTNKNATAFLCSNRHHHPTLLHNVTVNPNKGNAAFPMAEFFALDHPQLGVPSIAIDTHNIPTLITLTTHSHVPSTHKILSFCVQPPHTLIPPVPTDSPLTRSTSSLLSHATTPSATLANMNSPAVAYFSFHPQSWKKSFNSWTPPSSTNLCQIHIKTLPLVLPPLVDLPQPL